MSWDKPSRFLPFLTLLLSFPHRFLPGAGRASSQSSWALLFKIQPSPWQPASCSISTRDTKNQWKGKFNKIFFFFWISLTVSVFLWNRNVPFLWCYRNATHFLPLDFWRFNITACFLRAVDVTPSLPSELVRGLSWHFSFLKGFGVGFMLSMSPAFHSFLLSWHQIRVTSGYSKLEVSFKNTYSTVPFFGVCVCVCLANIPYIMRVLPWLPPSTTHGVLALWLGQSMWFRWSPELLLTTATGSQLSLCPKATSKASRGFWSTTAKSKSLYFFLLWWWKVGAAGDPTYREPACKGTNTEGSRADGWRRETRLGGCCLMFQTSESWIHGSSVLWVIRIFLKAV